MSEICNLTDDTYCALLNHVMELGTLREDRTGVGTKSIFGTFSKFFLYHEFPLITTKRVPFKSIVSELLWFLEGSGDERRLAEILYDNDRENLSDKTTIWTENANAPYWVDKAQFKGDLGLVYGKMWRSWPSDSGSIDQIQNVIEGIKKDPYSRRHIVTAWNPGCVDKMALPPCHMFIQFYVNEGYLDCIYYMRSVDLFLGAPFNIASYALLTMMIAQVCGLKPGTLIKQTGDTHIYTNHFEQVEIQLQRDHKTPPKVILDPAITNINDFKMDSFELLNYNPHPSIKAPMAV